MERNIAKLTVLVVVAATIAWSIPEKKDAGYDRFKTVGYDDIRSGNNITVIKDTETGCLYGQVEQGVYDIDTFFIENSCK